MWTDERVAALRRYWSDGLSASAIASRMDASFTRNAIIGKVHRLGLDPRLTVVRSKQIRRRRRKPKVEAVTPVAKQAAPPPPVVALPIPKPAPTDIVRVASIIDLEPGECKWPIGHPTIGFCGCTAIHGGPYCQHHTRRAFAPPQHAKAPTGAIRGGFQLIHQDGGVTPMTNIVHAESVVSMARGRSK